MAKIVLTGDGQSFDVEDEIAKDDDLLRSVVKSVSPAYAQPTFRRETKGDVLTVHVSKQAGTKGTGAIEALLAAPETENPVEEMRARMERLARSRKLSMKAVFALRDDVNQSLERGKEEQKVTSRAIGLLLKSVGVASKEVPTGF